MVEWIGYGNLEGKMKVGKEKICREWKYSLR